MRVVVLLGTKKGVFVAESDRRREAWQVRGPLTSGTWSMYCVGFDGGTIYASGASNWYGPAVWRSRDLGATWSHSSEGLTYGDGGPPVSQVWSVASSDAMLYAGVEPAGLFRSADRGATWQHVAALRALPSCHAWRPAGGGLSLHAIRLHPADPQKLWVAIGAGGVFRTGDGGATWEPCGPDLHPCVHALVATPIGADGGLRLYQQSHDGVYRSDDGGVRWLDVSEGLPSRFGFPLAVHPRDPDTVYAVPLEGDAPGKRHVAGGQMAVWRSRDGGATWQPLTDGFPRERTSLAVLRAGLAVDPLRPAGVYAGTTTGQVYWSADEGDTWRALPVRLPPVYAIAASAV